MLYNLMDGTEIKVGKQDLVKDVVLVEIDGGSMNCPMFQDEDGDIGFTIRNEEVLFHWLRHK